MNLFMTPANMRKLYILFFDIEIIYTENQYPLNRELYPNFVVLPLASASKAETPI